MLWCLTACANISAVLVDVNELAQSLDDVDVLPCPCYDQFRTFVQAVIQNFQALKYVPPVLALVVQSLIEHVHYFVKVGGAVADEIGVSNGGSNCLQSRVDVERFMHDERWRTC